MVEIRDGTGTGRKVGVTDENRIKSESVTVTQGHHTNSSELEAYHFVFQRTPISGGCCVAYIENENPVEMVIEGINIRAPNNQIVDVYLNDVGTPNGSGYVPINVNAGAGQEAQGVFQVGGCIGGLTRGNLADRIYIAGGNTTTPFNFNMDIIVPQNQRFTLVCELSGVQLDGTIRFYYHDPN